jgi:hypothetical protein
MPDAGHQIPDTGYRIPDTGYRIPDTGYRIPDTGYRILDTTGYRIPDTEYRIPDMLTQNHVNNINNEYRKAILICIYIVFVISSGRTRVLFVLQYYSVLHTIIQY